LVQGCAIIGIYCANEGWSKEVVAMSVMMQAFFWDSPKVDKQEHNWWNFVAEKVEDLGKAGFNALWLPPVSKASDHMSMGYDPYDYFDLGDYDQKGA
jgi:alpha-amylase